MNWFPSTLVSIHTVQHIFDCDPFLLEVLGENDTDQIVDDCDDDKAS